MMMAGADMVLWREQEGRAVGSGRKTQGRKEAWPPKALLSLLVYALSLR